MTTADVALSLCIVLAGLWSGLLLTLTTILHPMSRALDGSGFAQEMRRFLPVAQRSPTNWIIVIGLVVAPIAALIALRSGTAGFTLTALGLVACVAGPLLVSRFLAEPNYDVMLARRRYFRLNWIRAAATWTAFMLFATAAYTTWALLRVRPPRVNLCIQCYVLAQEKCSLGAKHDGVHDLKRRLVHVGETGEGDQRVVGLLDGVLHRDCFVEQRRLQHAISFSSSSAADRPTSGSATCRNLRMSAFATSRFPILSPPLCGSFRVSGGISSERFHRARSDLRQEGVIETLQVDLGGGKHHRWRLAKMKVPDAPPAAYAGSGASSVRQFVMSSRRGQMTN